MFMKVIDAGSFAPSFADLSFRDSDVLRLLEKLWARTDTLGLADGGN